MFKRLKRLKRKKGKDVILCLNSLSHKCRPHSPLLMRSHRTRLAKSTSSCSLSMVETVLMAWPELGSLHLLVNNYPACMHIKAIRNPLKPSKSPDLNMLDIKARLH